MPLNILPETGVGLVDIQPISFSMCVCNIDLEEEQIMRRLKAYGVTPTGKKIIDKEMLRRIELQKAKESTIVENKFLTVSKGEQEKIQQKKKEKKKTISNANINPNSMQGATIMGEQLFLATQMKKKKIEQQNEIKKQSKHP